MFGVRMSCDRKPTSSKPRSSTTVNSTWLRCAAAGGPRPRTPGARAQFLKELLAHTAAGLVILEGDRAAGEAVYRLADAVVSRGRP